MFHEVVTIIWDRGEPIALPSVCSYNWPLEKSGCGRRVSENNGLLYFLTTDAYNTQ
jgi:hypothetical protein